jgi:ribosomal protein S10
MLTCLILKSPNKKILFQSTVSLIVLLKTMQNSFQIVCLPKEKKLFTVLNSPHVNRKSQKQVFAPSSKILFFVKLENKIYKKLLVLFLSNIGVSFTIKAFS